MPSHRASVVQREGQSDYTVAWELVSMPSHRASVVQLYRL